jgi:uncharacterized 2Fe-2S/4Fe-4S cluster protein (DUF4445 family)
METYDIKFEPDTLHARAPRGTTILQAARQAGISLPAPCGGQGKCGKCRCQVASGPTLTDESYRGRISDEDFAQNYRLACRTTVEGDLVVYIPPESRTGAEAILEEAQLRLVLEGHASAVRKQAVDLPVPTLADQRSDLERLLARLEEQGEVPRAIDVQAVLPHLAQACRRDGFRVTAVEHTGTLIGVEPGDTVTETYGVAVDLGTTTVVAYLADLAEAHRLGSASEINPQVAYGDDLVSRITYIDRASDGFATLTSAARGAIRELIERLCASTGVSPERIYQVTVVGNSGMTHILLGADPRNIPLAPYIPCYRQAMTLPARDLGYTSLAPGARVTVLPNIAGWVGADTEGLILSTEIYKMPGTRVAIDIGTNGEIVVGGADQLVACSTAAGPAFEGAQILHGMRGAQGAIDHVTYTGGEIHTTTIGNAPPRGICGTGLIDAAAALLAAGVLLDTGRMPRPDSDEAARLAAPLRDRLIQREDGPAFILASAERSGTGTEVLFTQQDVRQLQLAKGAIAAGVRVALEYLGKQTSDVEEVLLAGAFGSYVDPTSAAAIGLFPPELAGRARAVGNAAGAGAYLALLDGERLAEAERIRERVEYLELASLPAFDMAFAEEMMFPSSGD